MKCFDSYASIQTWLSSLLAFCILSAQVHGAACSRTNRTAVSTRSMVRVYLLLFKIEKYLPIQHRSGMPYQQEQQNVPCRHLAVGPHTYSSNLTANNGTKPRRTECVKVKKGCGVF